MSSNLIRISILGVGLIGGSLARCWKGKDGIQVIGYSPNPSSIQKYLQLEVVDEAYDDLEKATANADVVVVCAPVGKIPDYLIKLSQLSLAPGCIITDVGSTKSKIMEHASAIAWNNACFIGGHPMAGSERSGVEAASAELFENAIYVLTPPVDVEETSLQRLRDLLEYTRAQIIVLDANTHDQVVGAISHLPHVMAVGLVNQVNDYEDDRCLYRTLAAGGFRDVTRIASSDPIIWRDILLQNRSVMLNMLDDWGSQVDQWKTWIQTSDGDSIAAEFAKANAYRKLVPERKRGLLHALHECYVDLPDRPGAIGQLATLLGQYEINLSNLHVNETRSDVPGVLRLTFRTADDLDRATIILTNIGYSIYRK